MDAEMRFLAAVTGFTSLWLLFLWGMLALVLRLLAGGFPVVDHWRGRLLRFLSWAWRIPLLLTLLLIILGLVGEE